MITGNEISEEPIRYGATLLKAEITVKLEWSLHSGNTDIDLHVVDPYGERIYYGNQNSASGGYLDWDDTHGPGPEHIHWDNAPAGTYKIYVHYYPNGDEDKSVVSYTVSVNADGVSYNPKSGHIAYDQMVPVGQFTIDESSATRSVLIKTLDETTPVYKKNLPISFSVISNPLSSTSFFFKTTSSLTFPLLIPKTFMLELKRT